MATPRGALACVTLAASVLTAACASSGAVPRPFPTPAGSSTPTAARIAAPAASPSSEAEQPATTPPADTTLIDTALSLRGVPYRNGGSDPNGFDCSGFTQYVFAQHGIALPRETREQFRIGEQIELKDVRVGDLVFFQTVAKGPSHVGIVVDDDRFVHAPSSTGVVRVEHLSLPYWSRRFIAARRIGRTQPASRPTPLPFPGAPLASRSSN